MNILETIIGSDKYNYKCYKVLKDLFEKNENFRNTIISGIKSNMISSFSDELWEKIKSQNIRRINNFEDVFKEGANIGYCTVTSKQLSFSFNDCYICGGILPLLVNTKNCKDGSHTWIEYEDSIIDTSLMLVINKALKQKLGYIEENRYNPNDDKIYRATKEWTLDTNIKKK